MWPMAIFGLTPKDAVDLVDLTYVTGEMKATYDSSAGTLTITNGSQSVALNLAGDFKNATWVLSKDASGGTTVVDPLVNTNSSPGLDHVAGGKSADTMLIGHRATAGADKLTGTKGAALGRPDIGDFSTFKNETLFGGTDANGQRGPMVWPLVRMNSPASAERMLVQVG
jgi:hypothetical protein